MKVTKEIVISDRGKIQIARIRDGGNSSWGEKSGEQEDSIRLAWQKESGGFDPISSAELPLWGLQELLRVAAQNDMFSQADLAEMIGHLTSSVYRQV